jgi:iron-sulfur cluster repair protein YtfE (RIC family)
MTTDDTRRRPLQGKVDFTIMYVVHDAFHRDLRCLTAAVEAGRTADPAVRAGWATFKNQLHVHHTAEDTSLWPPLRQKVTRPGDVAVLDAMEAEHARIDPLLAQVDTSLAAPGHPGLAGNAAALAQTLADHMKHEENQALPLVEAHLGPKGWAAFRKELRKSQGLRGGAEFIPWMLDGAPADTSKQVLSSMPPPARLLYRVAWRPRYARTPRWDTTTTRTTTERPGP